MEKAYDLKDLAEKLKAKGLPEVEQLAEKCYEGVKEWYIESASLSLSPIDNLVVPFIGIIDSIVKPQLDKIDGNNAE